MNAPPPTLIGEITAKLGKKWSSWLFAGLAISATGFGVLCLVVLLFVVAKDGLGGLDWNFITSFPSRKPEDAGILAALMGTLWVMGLTCLFFVPVGVGAAIYLEEFARRNWFTKLIETNISTLAGVPSLVYGLLGLAVFVFGINL